MERNMQLELDKRLLQFETYEDYLDSLVNPEDLFYLQSISTARKIAELGYRNTGETLDRDSFYNRKLKLKNLLFPVWKPFTLDSEGIDLTEPLQVELASRERLNRLGDMSTIIFTRLLTASRPHISGYIDFADRLEKESWTSFFQGKKRLTPRSTDLAYYNWQTGQTKLNETKNYQPIIDRNRGLVFKNLHDRTFIFIDPKMSPGIDTMRLWIKTNKFGHVVIYDHILRTKS